VIATVTAAGGEVGGAQQTSYGASQFRA
jgi:hypothetical protein